MDRSWLVSNDYCLLLLFLPSHSRFCICAPHESHRLSTEPLNDEDTARLPAFFITFVLLLVVLLVLLSVLLPMLSVLLSVLLFRCAAVSLRHLLSGAAVRYCCQCCCQCCYLRTHTLIGRSASGRVSLLDMRTGLLNVRWRAHEGDVTQVMAGVNGRLVTASSDHTCTLWNADDAMAVTRFKGANTVHECRHSPFPLTTGRLAPAIGIIEPGRTMRVCCEGLWWRCARIPVFGHRALMTWLIAAMLSIVPARALLVTLCLPPMSFRH